MAFCTSSCKTCVLSTTKTSECTECVDADLVVQTDKVSCGCKANFELKAGVCTEKPKPKLPTCFSQAGVASKGITGFGHIAVWDGRKEKKLVLVFSKPISHSLSILDERIKIYSVKLDGSDPISILGLKLNKVTSLNLLQLSYDTEIPVDRSIKFETQ